MSLGTATRFCSGAVDISDIPAGKTAASNVTEPCAISTLLTSFGSCEMIPEND
jgi:hypothetical protein